MDEAGHNVKEGSSSSTPMESLNSNVNDSVPSADDLAWADSCLMKFTEASDSDWSSFKESLLEIFHAPAEPVSLLAVDNGINDQIEPENSHTYPSGESVANDFSMMTDDHSDVTDEDEEIVQEEGGNATDVFAIGRKKKERRLKGKNLIENALLPDHPEFARVESSDSGFDLGTLSFEAETSFSDPIFQVWDLGVSDEQDEFTKALNSALVQSSSSTVAEGGQELAVEQMDDLIAGISGLSLGQGLRGLT